MSAPTTDPVNFTLDFHPLRQGESHRMTGCRQISKPTVLNLVSISLLYMQFARFPRTSRLLFSGQVFLIPRTVTARLDRYVSREF